VLDGRGAIGLLAPDRHDPYSIDDTPYALAGGTASPVGQTGAAVSALSGADGLP